MKKVLLSIAAFGLLPSIALAQAGSIDTSGLEGSVGGLTVVVNRVIPLLLAVAVVAFIVGIVRYLWAGGAGDKQKAKDHLIWGVIAITVILALFGISRLLINILGLDPAQLAGNEVPSIPPYQPIDTSGGEL